MLKNRSKKQHQYLRFLLALLFVLPSSLSQKLYAADGSLDWTKSFGGTGGEVGQAMAADRSGNNFMAGYFQGTVDFEGQSLTSVGGYDLVLTKYSSLGVRQWAKRFGGSGDEFVKAIALDGSGNILVV